MDEPHPIDTSRWKELTKRSSDRAKLSNEDWRAIFASVQRNDESKTQHVPPLTQAEQVTNETWAAEAQTALTKKLQKVLPFMQTNVKCSKVLPDIKIMPPSKARGYFSLRLPKEWCVLFGRYNQTLNRMKWNKPAVFGYNRSVTVRNGWDEDLIIESSQIKPVLSFVNDALLAPFGEHAKVSIHALSVDVAKLATVDHIVPVSTR